MSVDLVFSAEYLAKTAQGLLQPTENVRQEMLFAKSFVITLAAVVDKRKVVGEKPEKLRWTGDLQHKSGRFARIDSQKHPYFHNVQAIRANRLKPAIRNLLVPRNAIRRKRGFSTGTLKRFARIRRCTRICESIHANRAI